MLVAIMSTMGNLCSVSANRELAAQLQAVDRVVPFIVPSQGVAFEKFKWNLEALLAALRALAALADLRALPLCITRSMASVLIPSAL